jgi:hypothetical protein
VYRLSAPAAFRKFSDSHELVNGRSVITAAVYFKNYQKNVVAILARSIFELVD